MTIGSGLMFFVSNSILSTRTVISPALVLKTLPDKEIMNGCAEIVKHAAIADRALFKYLEGHYNEILELKEEVIEKLVHESVIIKSRVVNRDEEEKGERRKLNFGHTLGHAIEKVTGATHGEAVSAGMVAAARLSAKIGILKDQERTRVEKLLGNLNLPIEILADRARLLEAINRDKKREGDSLHFVLLKRIGDAVIAEISIKELEDSLI